MHLLYIRRFYNELINIEFFNTTFCIKVKVSYNLNLMNHNESCRKGFYQTFLTTSLVNNASQSVDIASRLYDKANDKKNK